MIEAIRMTRRKGAGGIGAGPLGRAAPAARSVRGRSRIALWCVLGMFSACCCSGPDSPLDAPGGAGDAAPRFYAPGEAGPCAYTIVPGPSRLPAYMSSVQNVTFTIPTSGATAPFPTIIIEPGYFSMATNLGDIQNQYASHGFLVIGVNNNAHFNLIASTLEPYRQALLQTVRFAVESSRADTAALSGLVDTLAIGITGHSMGGGGTIRACDSVAHPYNRCIRAAIAINPFGTCRGTNIAVPVALLASDRDSVVNPFMPGVSSSPADIFYSYRTIPRTTTKLFANFDTLTHNAAVDRSVLLASSGNARLFFPTMVSWFKLYLAGDERYAGYLDTAGAGFAEIESRFAGRGEAPAYVYHTP
jgi:hypothetical protein